MGELRLDDVMMWLSPAEEDMREKGVGADLRVCL